MRDNVERMGITFLMDNPLHQKAWDILQGIPKGGRTEYICKCLTEKRRTEELAAVVYTSVKKALDEYGDVTVKQSRANETQTNEADEIRKNLFGFMASLQNTSRQRDT